MKTSRSIESTTRLGKSGVGVGNNGGNDGGHNDKYSSWGSRQVHQQTH